MQDHAKEVLVFICMHYSMGKASPPTVPFSFSKEIQSLGLASHMEVTVFFKKCAAHFEENMVAINVNFPPAMFYLVQVVNIIFLFGEFISVVPNPDICSYKYMLS